MSLTHGTRLGSYEITNAIGAGGMGEVFRARDTKLDRDVAIKVLPSELSQDRERLARFEREANLLASLNHTNIAHVYGFENAALPDGSTAFFLAMELVEGEDLAERLKRGAIPVDEAVYRATRKGLRNLYWRPADGSGAEELLTSKADVVQSPASISRGGHVFFNETGASDRGGSGLWVMGLEGDRTPRRLLGEATGEESPAVSPDGRWFAYEATISARKEIFVSSFPGPGPRHQISTAGGTEPAWSGDGRELFFQAGDWLVSVSVNPGATFSSGPPRRVYEGRFMGSNNSRTSWSVMPDGQRFLRIQRVEPDRPFTRLEVTLDWAEELKAKMGQR